MGDWRGNDHSYLLLSTKVSFLEDLDLRLKVKNQADGKTRKGKISQARQARGQEPATQKPGVLLCVWRAGCLGIGAKKHRGTGLDKGRRLGAGCILGVQKHVSSENVSEPLQKIWVTREP
eukprot:13075707-Alexandrium_andersonii.AAC.1